MKIYLTLSLLFIIYSSFAQENEAKVLMKTSKTEMLYRGLVNPIEVLVCSSEYDSINIVGKDVIIRKRNDFNFEVIPQKEGSITLNLLGYLANRVDTLESKTYKVNLLPPPRFVVNGQSNGEALKIALQSQLYVFAETQCIAGYDINMAERITTFTMIFIFSDSLKMATSHSNNITDEQRQLISEMSDGGKIYVVDIKAKGPYGIVNVPSTSFTIVE